MPFASRRLTLSEGSAGRSRQLRSTGVSVIAFSLEFSCLRLPSGDHSNVLGESERQARFDFLAIKVPGLSVSRGATRASSATLPSQENGITLQIVDLVDSQIGHTRCSTAQS